MSKFKPVDQKVDFVALENKWLTTWGKDGLVDKYLHKNDSADKKFWFLDGPITANNPMGLHHAWGRTYKDLWQRFKNMQGFKQTFRNGFDNQGLWVEVGVEKELGFKTKKDIEVYGIEKFVNACKAATTKWAAVQTDQSKRLGYFMNWADSYFTLSDENNYTIWHFLKKCFEQNLIYKGTDSVPWCPRCGTAISNHEVTEGGYHDLVHDSIYFELPLIGRDNERLLVWTTTPWTLPANVAVAVHPDFTYWLVKGSTGVNFWVVDKQAKRLFGDTIKPVKTALGKELVTLHYVGPFDSFPIVQEARKENPQTFHSVVASSELVTADDGTGLVHIAPGCGQEDFALGKKVNLPILPAIDEAAAYLPGYGELTGQNAKDNPQIILDHPALKVQLGDPKADFIFEIVPFNHRYPVCWRCNTELVWRVVDEWYIKMAPLRQKLIASAKKAKWLPEWGLDREIDWLNNMDDWLISKKRYWGLALPIWECECGNFDVIGSKKELQAKSVSGWAEFESHTPHRPWVDEVTIKCSKCGKTASRVKDVGNPWLDAGIVGFATLIDPKTKEVSYLTDKKYWQEWFPADFVTECFPGQFRNWFYAILTMSTVLADCPPFKTLLGHALVRDDKGEEMHKSKGNAIWFADAAEKIGVDVMRWMYARQNPVQNLNFGYNLADGTRRQFHLILWNTYNYFVSYANLNTFSPVASTESENPLDRWLHSRLNSTIKEVTNRLENFDAFSASSALQDFLTDLSTWYIRRSRARVAESGNSRDKTAFFATLYQALVTYSQLLAPFVPFLSEEMYTNLTGDESVHLADWPVADDKLIDTTLETHMALVRECCEKGHALRKLAGLKLRQPLASVAIRNVEALPDDLSQLLAEELNVKQVTFSPGKGTIDVTLDTNLTPELITEGEARDIIRAVQDARKEAGCDITETVTVGLPAWPKDWEKEITRRTLADKLVVAPQLEIRRREV